MSKDEKIRGMKLDRVLVDGGAQTNIIPLKYVELLNARLIPTKDGSMQTATGVTSQVHFAVWLNVEIAGTTRVLVAIVIDGNPSYQLLLSRHWMASTKPLGDFCVVPLKCIFNRVCERVYKEVSEGGSEMVFRRVSEGSSRQLLVDSIGVKEREIFGRN